MTNEMKTVVNEEVTENKAVVKVAQSNDRYDVIVNKEGKYVRKAKYEDFCSIVPETEEQQIKLFNLLEGSDEDTNGMKEHVGQVITVDHVIFRSYDKVNENTGALEYGVLTYLIDTDGLPFVTSSKSVYFSMKNIFKVFGSPADEKWKPRKLQIVRKKGLQHDYIDVKPVI
jgi:hypothetical protein